MTTVSLNEYDYVSNKDFCGSTVKEKTRNLSFTEKVPFLFLLFFEAAKQIVLMIGKSKV